jgi:hypothetical protein
VKVERIGLTYRDRVLCRRSKSPERTNGATRQCIKNHFTESGKAYLRSRGKKLPAAVDVRMPRLGIPFYKHPGRECELWMYQHVQY